MGDRTAPCFWLVENRIEWIHSIDTVKKISALFTWKSRSSPLKLRNAVDVGLRKRTNPLRMGIRQNNGVCSLIMHWNTTEEEISVARGGRTVDRIKSC